MMTHLQFRAALKRLDLSQNAFARLIDSDPRTCRRWALDESPIPGTVAILLFMLQANIISVADIEKVKR